MTLTSDPAALVNAYGNLLQWTLVADGRDIPVAVAESLVAAHPNAVLETRCVEFDVVTMTHHDGRSALMHLDRANSPAPSIVDASGFVRFLVQAGTGQVEGLDAVRVQSGADHLLALPPSSGLRWDTPPWSRAAREPLVPPHAEVLLAALNKTPHPQP
jgi:hypothetical protein